MVPEDRRPRWTDGLTRNVVLLGVVSGLTDISSEMLYPILPLFLTGVLHAPVSVVGFIEGTAEATASILKAAGGWWSDRAGRRKPFTVWGYGLSAASKPLLALASAWPLVLVSRFVDRVGKGVRTSARDALLADSTDGRHRGKAFGFHRALDTLGAALGPLLALYLLEVQGASYRTVFLLSFIPAALGLAVLVAVVEDRPLPQGEAGGPEATSPAPPLPPQLKRFLVVYGIFCLGNSSDVFLLLRAKAAGFSNASVILAYVGYNIVYAAAAWPAGWLADRMGRRGTMSAGMAIFSAVYLGFAFASSRAAIWALFAVYGLYAALTENAAKALVSDWTVPQNRGTAMGAFNGTTGALAFLASSLAGLLWTHAGPAAPFLLASACGAAAALLLAADLSRPETGGAPSGDAPWK